MVGAPEEAEGDRSTGRGIQSGTSVRFYEWTPAICEDTPQIPTEWISRQLWDIFSWQMVQVSLLSHNIFYFCLLNAFTSLRAPAEQSQGDHLLQH